MSAISNFLTFLRSAIYAIDVRDGIADAIEQCYNDVNNPTLKTEALEAALQTKIDEGEMAALTIGDHTITAAKLAQGVIDNTLATSGAAADAKKTGDEIAAVKADLDALEPGLSAEAKAALLACFNHVAWSGTGGQSYYDALESALYPESWDYEWSSDSGELPEHMTATEYDFTTEPGALFAKTPILDFSYIGDCKLQITMKTGYVSTNNNPQVLIQNEVVGQNQYRGIKIILNTNLSTSAEHSMCAVSVNGANALIPGSNCNEYHTYELTANNNVYEVSIDGEPVEITQNTDVSAYFARTGMSCAEGYGGFIKSIKFKRFNSEV